MSSNIWTRCAERFEPQRLSGPAWRAVESQHVTSTRKLVDSDDEQQVLEALIETAKPPWPTGRRFVGLAECPFGVGIGFERSGHGRLRGRHRGAQGVELFETHLQRLGNLCRGGQIR